MPAQLGGRSAVHIVDAPHHIIADEALARPVQQLRIDRHRHRLVNRTRATIARRQLAADRHPRRPGAGKARLKLVQCLVGRTILPPLCPGRGIVAGVDGRIITLHHRDRRRHALGRGIASLHRFALAIEQGAAAGNLILDHGAAVGGIAGWPGGGRNIAADGDPLGCCRGPDIGGTGQRFCVLGNGCGHRALCGTRIDRRWGHRCSVIGAGYRVRLMLRLRRPATGAERQQRTARDHP